MLGHTSVTTTGIYARIADMIVGNPTRQLAELMGLI
jgi:site-specific recombinase XerD